MKRCEPTCLLLNSRPLHEMEAIKRHEEWRTVGSSWTKKKRKKKKKSGRRSHGAVGGKVSNGVSLTYRGNLR